MDPSQDARLRLAARRHPSTPAVGSLHYAQHQLHEVTRSFLVLMKDAGFPGAQPLPPPAGRDQWPRRHQARHALGWPVQDNDDGSLVVWIDTNGSWWGLRYEASGALLDAHPLGSPIDAATQLRPFVDALEQILLAFDAS